MTDPAIRSQAANEYKAIRSSIPIDTPAAMLVIGEKTMAIAQGHTLTPEEVMVMETRCLMFDTEHRIAIQFT